MKYPNPLAGATVSKLMVPLSAFIGSRDLVTEARAIMRRHKVKVLPVVDGGRLEGITTQRDIMRVTSTKSNIPVAGVMQPLKIFITPSTDLSKAARNIADLGLDEVPVIQSPASRTVVGVLKVDDILRSLLGSPGQDLKVEEAMTSEVISCESDDELSSVWDLMEREELSGLPVVQREKGKVKVVGVITRTDIINSGAARIAGESKKGKRPKVKTIMLSLIHI